MAIHTPELVVFENIEVVDTFDTPTFIEPLPTILFGTLVVSNLLAANSLDIQLRLVYPSSDKSVSFNNFPNISVNGVFNFYVGLNNLEINSALDYVVGFVLPNTFSFRFTPNGSDPFNLTFGVQIK